METESDFRFQRDKDRSGKESQLNFNTLLGAIALAVIFWVGNKTQSTSEIVAKIETSLPYVTQSVLKLEGQIAQLVTRAEMQGRFDELTAKAAVMDKRIMQLEFEKRKPDAEK